MADGLKKAGVSLVVEGLSQFINGMAQAAKAFDTVGKAASNQANTIAQSTKTTTKAYSDMIAAQRAAQIAQERQTAAAVRQSAAENEYRSASVATTAQLVKAISTTAAYNIATIQLIEAKRKATEATNEYQQAEQAASSATQSSLSFLAELGATAGGATAELGALGGVLVIAQGALSALGAVGKVAVGVITTLTRAFGTLLSALKSVVDKIFDFVGGIAKIAGGILFADVIRNIASEMRQLSTETVEAIADFQKLDIQFKTLAARDIAQSQMIPLAQAMIQAGQAANELLGWVKQIAVTTPYTVKDISTTLALARAYGIQTGAAKTLITATIDFASAMGLTSDHVYRIVYNMGQMVSQGKITGREIRDLAISFFPVQQILEELGDQFGKTKDEMYKFALEGGVPLNTFLNKFVEIAQRDFPGAAAAMSHTLTGVISNLKDFFQVVVGTEILGPTFNKITEIMANALDNLLTPAVRNAARAIGQYLLYGFYNVRDVIIGDFLPAIVNLGKALGIIPDSVKSAGEGILKFSAAIRVGIQTVSAAIQGLADWINQKMSALAKNGETWGHNLIVSFAKGMATALSLVVNVLITLGNIIASLLRAFSPPKLLPDLPKWGMNAMRSYLEGFLMVDFDILKGIQGPLESALDLLEQTGKIGENMAGKILAEFSTIFARGLATGVGLDKALAKLSKIGGPFGPDLLELAKRYLVLRDALKELTRQEDLLTAARQAEQAAEEAQKRAQASEQAARVKVNDQIRAYNNLVRKGGVDKAVLKAKLGEVNASQQAAKLATEQRKKADDAVTIAQRQVEAQQALVEAAQEYVDKMQEAVDLQKELVSQLLDLTKKQVIQIKVETGGAAAEAPAIDTGGLLAGMGEVGQTLREQWNIADELSMMQYDAWSAMQSIQASVDALAADISAQFTPLTEEGGLLDQLATSWEPINTAIGQIDWEKVNAGVQGFGTALAGIDWDAIATGVANVVSWIQFMGDRGFIEGVLRTMGVSLEKGFNDIFGGLEEYLDGWFADRTAAWNTWSGNFGQSWNTFWQGVEDWINAKWELMKALTDAAVQYLKTGVMTTINQLKADWEEAWTNIKTIVYDIWFNPNGIVQSVIKGVGDLWDIIKTGPKALWTLLTDLKTLVLDKVSQGFNAVATAVGNVASAISGFITAVTSGNFAKALEILKGFKLGSPPPYAVGFNMVGKAIRDFAKNDLRYLQQQMDMLTTGKNQLFNAQMGMIPMQQTISNRTVNLNVPYQRGGGMDLAVFRAIIRDEVRHAILE